MDMISNLPDELLTDILSRLPTKDAFRSSIFAKSWTNYWKSVDNVVFEFGDVEPLNYILSLNNFAAFVLRTIGQFQRQRIKKLSLRMPYGQRYSEVVIRCSEFASDRRANTMIINLENIHMQAQFPAEFSVKSSIVELYGWDFTTLKTIEWNTLRSLSLSGQGIRQQVMARIMAGCPRMESLTLSGVLELPRLNIVSPNLRILIVRDFEPEEAMVEDVLEIHAPHIQELELSGSCWFGNVRLVDVSALVSAKITFTHDHEWYVAEYSDEQCLHDISMLLVAVSHVVELTAGLLCIKVLSLAQILNQASPALACRYLTLHLALLEYELPGVARFLNTSLQLENLVIEMVTPSELYFQRYSNAIFHINGFNYSNSLNGVVVPNLKNVRLDLANMYCFGDGLQFIHVVRFDFLITGHLLLNAIGMKKLVVRSTAVCGCNGNCATKLNAPLLTRNLVDTCFIRAGIWEFKKKKENHFEFYFL